MGDFVHKDGNGGLFKNTRKKTPNAPDFTGNCTIDGTVYRIAGWKKETQKGQSFLSLKFTDEAGEPMRTGDERPRAGHDEEPPF